MARVEVESDVLVVAHAKDEGFETPVVHGELAFEPGDEGIAVVLTLRVVGETPDDAARERAAKLKTLVVRTLLPAFDVKIRWDPAGPPADPPCETRRPAMRGIQVAERLERPQRIGRVPFSKERDR